MPKKLAAKIAKVCSDSLLLAYSANFIIITVTVTMLSVLRKYWESEGALTEQPEHTQ